MSKKDYIAIARAISSEVGRHRDIDDYKASSVVEWIVHGLCREFMADNPAFDKERFLEAAGFPAT